MTGLEEFETLFGDVTIATLIELAVVIAFMAKIYKKVKGYVKGSLSLFNHRTNVDIQNRLVCYDIKELGKQLKKLGMLIVQDQVWGRVTANRAAGKSTRYYMDEFHLLLKEEQTAAYSVEIWKRFRKWGGIPTGITQNVKDLLSSYEVQNIFENSDFVYMLNQAAGDRQILAKQLNISPHQLSYVTHSGEGEGLLFFGNVILPFVDRFPQDLELYRIMTTKLGEVAPQNGYAYNAEKEAAIQAELERLYPGGCGGSSVREERTHAAQKACCRCPGSPQDQPAGGYSGKAPGREGHGVRQLGQDVQLEADGPDHDVPVRA